MSKLFKILLFFLVIALPVIGNAQVSVSTSRNTGTSPNRGKFNDISNINNRNSNSTFPSDTIRNDADTLPKGIIFETNIIPDSTLINSVNIFHYEPISTKIHNAWHPSLLPTGIELNNKINTFNDDYYLSTGNLGHACYSVFPKLSPQTDFKYKQFVFEAYSKTPTNINFYQTEKPFTSLSYASSTEDEFLVEVLHSQNITNRWNFSFHYNLINSEGLYTNSKTKNNYLDATSNYYSKNLRYQIKGGIIWQKLNLQENGGISNDSLFTNDIQTNRGGMPVSLYNAYTDYNTFTVFAQQTFTLAHQPGLLVVSDTLWFCKTRDSIQNDTLKNTTLTDSFSIKYDTTIYKAHVFNLGAFVHNIEFNKTKHNYTDPATDTLHYNSIYFDSVLTMDSTYVYTLENSLFWTNDIYKDYQFHNPIKLSIGIKHTAIGIHDILHYTTFSVIKPFAKAIISTRHFFLTLDAETSVSETYKKGDYALSGELAWKPDSNHNFNVFASISGNDPDYFYYNYVSNTAQWNFEDYNKIHTQKLGVNYKWKDYIEVYSSFSNVINNVWFDENARPYQTDKSAVLSQSYIKGNIQFGIFHWQMFNLLQFTSDKKIFNLPLFATKHSIFVELHLFKKALVLQTGFDLRYNTKYYADTYNPAIGYFCRQNEYSVGGTPWADFFVAGQIKHAILYAKVLHFNTLFEKKPNYFLLPHYPGQDLTLQWGVIWRFFD